MGSLPRICRNPLINSLSNQNIEKLKKIIVSRNSFLLVIFGIFLTFLIGIYLNIPFLNFIELKIESAKYVVDQRISNIATIVSMTLAVVGFLLTNLAIKESFIYQLLFRYSKLYPILYFTLATIGSLIIISLLRDTIKSEVIYEKLIITSTYLSIIVLLFIGYLFRSIIHFTNPNKIHKIIENELIFDSKNTLINNLLKPYGDKIFVEVMEEFKLKEYNQVENFFNQNVEMDFSDGNEPQFIEIEFSRDLLLFDLNLGKLVKFIKKKANNENLRYKSLSIAQNPMEYDNYILSTIGKNTIKDKKNLKSCLLLKNKKKFEIPSNNARVYLDEKFNEYSKSGEYKKMEPILESYLKVFELDMKNQVKNEL